MVLRPFDTDPPRIALSVAWRADDRTRAVAEFVRWLSGRPLVQRAKP